MIKAYRHPKGWYGLYLAYLEEDNKEWKLCFLPIHKALVARIILGNKYSYLVDNKHLIFEGQEN
jgi:hypothetical protein